MYGSYEPESLEDWRCRCTPTPAKVKAKNRYGAFHPLRCNTTAACMKAAINAVTMNSTTEIVQNADARERQVQNSRRAHCS